MNRLEFTKTLLLGGAAVALAPNMLVAKPEVPSMYTPEVFKVLSNLFADDTNQIVILKNKLFLNVFGWNSEEALERGIGMPLSEIAVHRSENAEFYSKHYTTYYHPDTFNPFSQFSIEFDNMVEMGEFVKKFPPQTSTRFNEFLQIIVDLYIGRAKIDHGGIIMLGDQLSKLSYYKMPV